MKVLLFFLCILNISVSATEITLVTEVFPDLQYINKDNQLGRVDLCGIKNKQHEDKV
ncbi:hypothetical protein [Pseudoalteromonas sp. TB64]|uniref:hypothetical protein n=1 Tax=Pseudoalteromonas sp. TB64 TaxID=1938600 RepID=UPI00041F8EAE|nr:hypothetical protein [Pseudoalteromonas sp. TB64]